MVGIVSGNTLGLELGSLATLGRQGLIGDSAVGHAGERAWVNVASGDLVVQDADESLAGVGALLRTYNSQGQLDDPNGDGWRYSTQGRAVLSGTANAAGSTIARVGADGSAARYEFDADRSVYVSAAGGGAFDTFTLVDGNLVWTDGDSGASETYAGAENGSGRSTDGSAGSSADSTDSVTGSSASSSASSGRLLARRDTAGNIVQYLWSATGLISEINATRPDGTIEAIRFLYSGTRLTSVRTSTTTAGIASTRTRVRYAYDVQGRLATVQVDLTPEDGTVTDGKVWLTTYRYDGNSTRLAGIAQTDGTVLNFTWVEVGND